MDPVSAIGIAGGAIQITTLITKTIHGLSTLHGKFSNADLTLNSLIAELLTIKAAITQLHELAQYNLNGTPKHPEYIEGLDVALDGCTAIVDVLSEEVAQLTPISSNEEPLRGMGLRAKVKVIWKEDLMKEHSQMLHAQVLALQLLLQACHWYVAFQIRPIAYLFNITNTTEWLRFLSVAPLQNNLNFFGGKKTEILLNEC